MKDDGITRVTVRIMGEEYVLRSDASADHVRQVARTVNDKMQAIANAQPQLDLSRIAIMGALALADELHRSQQGDRPADPKSEPKPPQRGGRTGSRR